MKTLVFATNNQHKLAEIQELLGDAFVLKTMKDIECHEDIVEDAPDLQGNAQLKARYIKEHFGFDCFADDTGLEIEALDGEPGVYSARYAGAKRSSEDNMDLVLSKLAGKEHRKAQFRTAICLILDNEEHLFEGIVEGEIALKRSGEKGFGYDPIFLPEGQQRSFAEMSSEEKNAISHRGRAFQKMIEFLQR